ncbi:MAG: hypothetical protein OEO83_03275 [Alphaproteobacteria bacterium]|nr:hypothetical protein [Alphaproteobacteria bacterium]
MGLLSLILRRDSQLPELADRASTTAIQSLSTELRQTFEVTQVTDLDPETRDALEHLAVLEDNISRTLALNLTDAAVQVMLAISLVERIEERLVHDEGDTLRRIQSLLFSVLNAIAEESGADLPTCGAELLLSPGALKLSRKANST